MGPNFLGMKGLIFALMLDINDFLGGYFIVTARYLMVTTSYSSLPSGYCLLLVVTVCYRSLPARSHF